ncbi:MAG TPA: trypsin-like peptidase domain-containing protein, partial [Gemmata sp.]|nr:trypsin-like peptidase domain-containing protein [Gemmata sp.]
MVTSLVLAIAAALSSQTLPPGCAWVRAENDAAGAGFVVDRRKKLLVTCRHVVADRKKVDVFFPWYRDRKLETSRDEYLGHRVHLRERGLLVTGTVLRTSDELDLALLELESIPDAVNAIELASRSPGPGEPLHVVGNRFDLETVWNITTGPVRV